MDRPAAEPLSPPELRPRVLLAALFGLYSLVAVGMNAVLPLGEAPDEPGHFDYIQHLARTGSLPVGRPDVDENVTVEAFQPPGYYALAALLTAPWSRQDVTLYYNPEFTFERPTRGYLPGPAHAFPWRGAALGWHLARLLSTVLGAVTLWLSWRLAMMLMDNEWAALGAVAFLACNPQFIYIHSVLSNDAAATAAAAFVMWTTLRMWHDPSPRTYALAGLAVALAAMAKATSFVGTIAPAAAGLMALHRMEKCRGRLLALAALGLIPAALAGWWFARNIVLYGDYFGIAIERQFLSDNFWPEPLSARQYAAMLPRTAWEIFRTGWGSFGWVAFSLPGFVCVLILLAHLPAAAGLIAKLPRRRADFSVPTFLLVLLLATTLLAYLVRLRTINMSGWQGRLLMPVLPIVAIGFVAGWRHWLRGRERALALAILAAGVAVLVVAMGFVFIPAYL